MAFDFFNLNHPSIPNMHLNWNAIVTPLKLLFSVPRRWGHDNDVSSQTKVPYGGPLQNTRENFYQSFSCGHVKGFVCLHIFYCKWDEFSILIEKSSKENLSCGTQNALPFNNFPIFRCCRWQVLNSSTLNTC